MIELAGLWRSYRLGETVVNALAGVSGTQIAIVWEPVWSPQKISEEGRKMLGIDQDDDD